MRKLIVGFAVSIDGFIQGPNGEIDWIIYDKEQFKKLGEMWAKTDAILYGRKTYEEVFSTQNKSKKAHNPFAHMKHYVFSSSLSSVDKAFTLVNGDTVTEVNRIKNESGKDIVVFGGGVFASALINLGLVDELVLAICPVLLGKGKPFFTDIQSRKNFVLKETVSYSSGLVSITYSARQK